MPSENLYFIAVVAPEPIASEITVFREDFAMHYGSRAALKNMPHITLKAPFKFPSADHLTLLEWWDNLVIEVPQFELTLEGFGTFPNRRNPVVFVKPATNLLLKELQKNILEDFIASFPRVHVESYERSFNPHMTVAYRDLTWQQYEAAWQVYRHKHYSTAFTVTGISLLQHNGRQWSAIAHHMLG